jgi:sterol desaturase/sphingolipid hydroxylase (fatty acid hydroxylase superfamily)
MLLGWIALVAWAIPVFVVAELLVPFRRERVAWRGIAIGAALVGIDAAVTRAISLPLPPATLVRCAAAFGVAEVLAYATHRAMHGVPLLWRFHRFHHVDEPLAWHVAWRIHPIDAALFAAANVGACALVGAPLPAGVAFVVARRVWTIVIHANVAWPRSLVDALIATPSFHRRHHREDLAPANFAGTLPIIDLLFGTYARSPRS